MSKKIDLIYSVLEIIRETYDDSEFTEEFIADQLDSARGSLMRQLLRYSGDVTEDFIQQVELNLSLADASLIEGNTDFKMLQSQEIPTILRIKRKPYITRVGSVFISKPSFTYVAAEHLPWVGKGRFNANAKYYAYLNNKIVIKGNANDAELATMEVGVLRAVFSSPDDVETATNWNYEYPFPDSYRNELIQTTLQLISPKIELPTDKTNDAENTKAEN